MRTEDELSEGRFIEEERERERENVGWKREKRA